MITLVFGPPCGGKTTYALAHAKPGDVVVDHDLLAQAAGSPQSHNHSRAHMAAAEAEFYRLANSLPLDRDAWVVRSCPGAQARAAFMLQVGAAECVLVSAPYEELLRRAATRPNPEATVAAIDGWFRRSERRPRRHPSW